MDNNPKRTAAINLLVDRGIWPINYVPMGLRLLWRIGIDVPPPIFLSYWANVLLGGSIPALIYTIMIGLVPWLYRERSLVEFAVGIAVFWLIVGLVRAFTWARLRRKHNLPLWRQIRVQPNNAN